jgi:eukaryotic-like serine/threonine-protein kinase
MTHVTPTGASMNAVNSERERRTSAEAPKACPSCGVRYAADALFCPLDGAPLMTSPVAIAAAAATDAYVGREILGHIEIRQLVGIGAMGRVYRAFQKGIDRDVAIKILHRELSSNQALVARFHREAKVASLLAHPNVVHVLLVGQLPDCAMYIVMEYLDGMSLQSALAAAGGALPLPRVLHIALQLCDAAGEAHAQGIVHRDVKPENVMLVHRADDPDFVKVLDFGIARLNWGDQSMATAAGLIFGTARYISPEGARGEGVGPQGDVYSLATTVYQMLCGRTPFDAGQAVALLVQQIHDAPPPLKSIPRASYVPDRIADVVMRNLSKKPEERAENARAFGRALLDAAVASGLSAQDILARPRPSMAGEGRASHASAVQLPSMQRTRQFPLEPDVAVRIGAAAAPRGDTLPIQAARGDQATAYETPAPSVVETGAAPRQTQAPTRTEVSTQAGAGVEATMDGDPVAPGSRPPAPSSKPPSSVEITLAGAEAPGRSSVRRALLLVVACFLIGALGMAGVAYKIGLLGGASAHAAQLDKMVARADEALLRGRWETPPGDNVLDLTDEGLRRWPKDSELLGIRALACREVLAAARSKHDAGDVTEALRLARLAARLDPGSEDAGKVVSEWASVEAQAQQPSLESSVPPLMVARPAASAASSGRAVIEASNAKPGLGQPVDFAAHLVGASGGARPRVEGARFRVSGPGIAAGTELAALEDGSGVFRTTFTFLQGGRFEVSFGARADGAPVRATRVVVVGDPSGSTPGPAPPASAKWL